MEMQNKIKVVYRMTVGRCVCYFVSAAGGQLVSLFTDSIVETRPRRLGFNNNNNNNNNILLLLLFTAIGLSPSGSGYFTCIHNMKLVTTKFKSGGLHEKHVVATWNLGNHLSICL